MRYKLVSLGSQEFGDTFIQDNGQIYIPRILNFSDVVLNSTEQNVSWNPTTDPTLTESYTLIVADATLIKIFRGSITNGTQLNTSGTINANGSITLKFAAGDQITFGRISGKTGSTSATLFGDKTGATSTITITVS